MLEKTIELIDAKYLKNISAHLKLEVRQY